MTFENNVAGIADLVASKSPRKDRSDVAALHLAC